MPLLLHALLHGVDDADVLDHWQAIVQDILKETQIPSDQAMTAVDGTRDRWIQSDLEGWLSLHRFYPGVIEKLRAAIADGIYPTIISTKEGRFIQALLSEEGVDLPSHQIIGKEVKQPKTKTLRQLIQTPPADAPQQATIWFVEDRLKTLEKVKAEPDLAGISLFLADWGYNTNAEKEQAQRDSRIHLLSLSQLVREFSSWNQAAA
jgi:phosphoglycolate phosphatase-like HAD superfamily hydrolase